MTRPAPARKRRNATTTVEDIKEMREKKIRRLKPHAGFKLPVCLLKDRMRRYAPVRTVKVSEKRAFNFLLSPVCAALPIRHPERSLRSRRISAKRCSVFSFCPCAARSPIRHPEHSEEPVPSHDEGISTDAASVRRLSRTTLGQCDPTQLFPFLQATVLPPFSVPPSL